MKRCLLVLGSMCMAGLGGCAMESSSTSSESPVGTVTSAIEGWQYIYRDTSTREQSYLDVQWSGTENGTPIQLWDCNGTESQRWIHIDNLALMNPRSGRCLDVPNNDPNPVPLQLWDCNGTFAQHWSGVHM